MLLVLYILTQRTIEHAKTAKRFHAYNGYTSTYIVNILNSFNHELQIKNTESAIKEKLIIDHCLNWECLNLLRHLVLVFKKIKVMMKQSIVPFLRTQ